MSCLLLDVPKDVLLLLCGYLDGVSLVRLRCTCRRLRQKMGSNETVWKRAVFANGLAIRRTEKLDPKCAFGAAMIRARDGLKFVRKNLKDEACETVRMFMAGYYGAGKSTFLKCLDADSSMDNGIQPAQFGTCDMLELCGKVGGINVKVEIVDWFVQVLDVAFRLVELYCSKADICVLNFCVASRSQGGTM